jgi:hypothetical protein
MILKTYRIDQPNYDITEKYYLLRALFWGVLAKDPYWHFFLDQNGGTLRFSPNVEEKVRNYLTKHLSGRGMKWKRSTDYDPTKHEYFGVSFLGNDMIPLFHDMSVLSVKYPGYILRQPILERLNHGLINMSGVHDFRIEAEIYLELAMGRARFVNYNFRLPKWVYKFFIRHWPWKKYENLNVSRRKNK